MPEPFLSKPLPPMIERNLRAQALLPSQRPLVDFFTRGLERFRSSRSKFEVLCTAASQPSFPPAAIPPRTRPRVLVVLDSSFNPPTKAHLRMTVSAIQDVRGNNTGGANGQLKQDGALRLLLLLAVNNADKAPKPAAFEQRLAMMWAFARDIQQTLIADNAVQETDGTSAEGDGEDSGFAIDIALSTEPYFTHKSTAIAESDFYLPGDTVSDKERPEQIILAGFDTLIRIFNPKYYGNPTESSQTPIRQALDPFFDRARLRITMRTDDEWGGKDEQLAYVESLASGGRLESMGGNREWAKRIDLVDGRAAGEDIVSSTVARQAAQQKDSERLTKTVPPQVKKWLEAADLYNEGGSD